MAEDNPSCPREHLACGLLRYTVDVRDRLSATYVGKSIDQIVVEFGPPKATFKLSSGDTSYLWEIGAAIDINTYKGSGDAQTFYCRLKVIASPRGIVSDISTEDSSNGYGESFCARRLGIRRQT